MNNSFKTTWSNLSYRDVQKELAAMRSVNKYEKRQAAVSSDKSEK